MISPAEIKTGMHIGELGKWLQTSAVKLLKNKHSKFAFGKKKQKFWAT